VRRAFEGMENLPVVALIWGLTLCALAILPIADAKGVKLLPSWRNPNDSDQKSVWAEVTE
jgi:hypothetical protein